MRSEGRNRFGMLFHFAAVLSAACFLAGCALKPESLTYKTPDGTYTIRPGAVEPTGPAPIRKYDTILVHSIKTKWYDLLDKADHASFSKKRGVVVLEFTLKYDGTVSDMSVVNNTVGDALEPYCKRAILDSAPFAVWPEAMRKKVGDKRHITFRFMYE